MAAFVYGVFIDVVKQGFFGYYPIPTLFNRANQPSAGQQTQVFLAVRTDFGGFG